MSDETADETKDVPEDGRNGEAHGVRRKTVAIIVAVVVVALAGIGGATPTGRATRQRLP